MKKLTAFLAATAILVYTGCNINEEGGIVDSGESKEISVKKSGPIAVVVNSGRKSRASLSIEESTVTGAIFELHMPGGDTIVEYWEKEGGYDTLYFPVENNGEYDLVISERDDSGNEAFSSHVFEIEAGKNYVLHVTLGGSVQVVVNGDSTSNPITNNLVFDADWYTAAGPDSSSFAYNWLDGSVMHAVLYAENTPDEYGWAALYCDPMIDFAAYKGIMVGVKNSDTMYISLMDELENTFVTVVPPTHTDTIPLRMFDYLEFKQADWNPGTTVLDLDKIVSISFEAYSSKNDSLILEMDYLNLY